MNRDRFEEALTWASELHADQRRKGKGVPYVFHLLATAAIVGESGGDENQVIAALLHDEVEDAGGAPVLAEIRSRFGDDVADLVDGCTDTDAEEKPPWRPRKEAYVARLRSAPPRLRLVSAADKLHNARCLETDLRAEGDCIWERFRGRRDGTLWYYGAILDALQNGWNHPVIDELARVVARIRALAGEPDPAPMSFISEAIEPRGGTVSAAALARGEPSLPESFAWRGSERRIVEVLEQTKDLKEDRGDIYVRRHVWRLRMDDGSIWNVYFTRQPLRAGRANRPSAPRWFLKTREDADAG